MGRMGVEKAERVRVTRREKERGIARETKVEREVLGGRRTRELGRIRKVVGRVVRRVALRIDPQCSFLDIRAYQIRHGPALLVVESTGKPADGHPRVLRRGERWRANCAPQ